MSSGLVSWEWQWNQPPVTETDCHQDWAASTICTRNRRWFLDHLFCKFWTVCVFLREWVNECGVERESGMSTYIFHVSLSLRDRQTERDGEREREGERKWRWRWKYPWQWQCPQLPPCRLQSLHPALPDQLQMVLTSLKLKNTLQHETEEHFTAWNWITLYSLKLKDTLLPETEEHFTAWNWRTFYTVKWSSQILKSKQCNPLIRDIKEGHKASTQTKFNYL